MPVIDGAIKLLGDYSEVRFQASISLAIEVALDIGGQRLVKIFCDLDLARHGAEAAFRRWPWVIGASLVHRLVFCQQISAVPEKLGQLSPIGGDPEFLHRKGRNGAERFYFEISQRGGSLDIIQGVRRGVW